MHPLRFTLQLSGFFYPFIVRRLGGVIGCKQFSSSGDAVWRLIMGCRRMLGVEDRVAIMAGVNAGLSQTRIAHLIGRSPSVVCRQIARHTGPDGQYRAEEAGGAARAARRRPKKRLLDCDEVLRRRVIADLSQGAHSPPWILLSTLTARSAARRSTRGAIEPRIPSHQTPRPSTVWSPPWRRPDPPAVPLGHE